ncbi:hypothetical protein F5Y07DRAFT_386707 [Xylaria sp. FL0933]|nr:hypothetical protein F5Y07DRAFT_386707 [Xylaria sp. FL0933]
MDSSFAEQTHANPDGSVVGPSVRDVTVTGGGTVTAVTTAARRGLISGDGAAAAAAVTPAVSPAALTSRSGSEFFSSAHAHAPAPVPAAAAPSQAPQAPEAFPSSSTPSSTPNLNSHPPPPSSSPPHNSSKLPAYRFADLNKDPIALPSLLQQQQQHQQHHRIPPSPVSPDSDQLSPQPAPDVDDVVSPPPSSEQLDPAGSRASTFQPKSASLPATTSSAHLARSASLDTTNALPNTTGVRSPSGRAPPSPIPPSAPEADAVSGGSSAEATKRRRESSSAQRELLLPKTLQRATKPPVSYRPRTSISGSGTGASIPPIRSFRSSGERRSLVLDMNLRTSRNLDGGDDSGDSNHRDRTLRALEGRRGDERPDGDDSGDLFLKIAREDSSQRTPDSGRTYHADNSNAISRVARSARRPLSVATSPYQSPSYRSPSPPRMSRRLSEQESRIRGLGNDQGERAGPPVSYRGHSREPHSEDFKFRGAPTSLRASPLTPRTLTFQDHSEPNSAHRRRQPSVDRGSFAFSRATSLKQVNVNFSHPRTFNSSPLVPQTAEPPKHDAQPSESTPVEGTDSTTSTAAPSTVWDELEELKSRIHRLELTGKLPPTSSAAISRASDERPPTANTNATTLSASPKRGASSIVQSVETATVPKDSHPLLNSALAKSKEFLTPEVYDALEAATIDALTLAAMMGTAGQPGPISSGNSNIGSSTGTVTDRQLRKKADSVCRSLTELCLALSENAGAAKHQQITPPPAEDVTVTSPTITQFSGFATQRRPSAPANRAIELATSPRTTSRYEEKRATILQASALPSPRYSSNAPTSTDAAAAGRKSSLLFSRARRAGTEEPEDGRRTSTLLTSRRAGTEEPEDLANRKPILSRGLSRGRRATLDNGEDDSRLRTPSRAITEVNGLRPREYISHLPPPPITKEADTLANSALPRRRLGSTVINTRLAQPAAVTTPTSASAIVTPNRRYFDRPTPSRETAPEGDRVTEDRPQRQFSLARSGSLNRRVTNRQSMIVTPSTTTTGYYR